MNFDELRKANRPFVAVTPKDFDAYKEWAARQVCEGCGAPASERTAEKPWATETLCGACSRKTIDRS